MQGVPYVIYWRSTFSCYAASHFREALFSVVQRYIVKFWAVKQFDFIATLF